MEEREGREKPVEGRGRSAKKRAAKAVEELALRLAEMPEAQWKRLSAPEEIRGEIHQARTTKGGSSRKRQIKHLAGVLRRHEEEAEALRSYIEGTDAAHFQETKEFHRLEELRDRLCDAELFPAALQEALRTFPRLEEAALARLARSVHDNGDRRAFREIFRRLRKAFEETAGE